MLHTERFKAMINFLDGNYYVRAILIQDRLREHGFDIQYLHMRGEMLGYYKTGKEIVMEGGKLPDKGLNLIKPTKIFRALYGDDMNDSDYERLANAIKSYISQHGDEHGDHKEEPIFSIVKGELISHYYHHANYDGAGGTLGNSCMKKDEHQKYNVFEIYEKNHHICSLLVLRNKEMRILGRALLWTVNGKTYMDTAYTVHDKHVITFINYAVDNGFYYKSQQSRQVTVFDMYNKQKVLLPDIVSAPLIWFNEDAVLPYIDTMRFIIRYKGMYRIQNAMNRHDYGRFKEARQYSTDYSNTFVNASNPVQDYHRKEYHDEYKRYVSTQRNERLTQKKLYDEPPDFKEVNGSEKAYLFYNDDWAPIDSCIKTTHGYYRNRYIQKEVAAVLNIKDQERVYYRFDPAVIEYNGEWRLRREFLVGYSGQYIEKVKAKKFTSPHSIDGRSPNIDGVFNEDDFIDVPNYHEPVPSQLCTPMHTQDGTPIQLYSYGDMTGYLTEDEWNNKEIYELLPLDMVINLTDDDIQDADTDDDDDEYEPEMADDDDDTDEEPF